MKGCDDMTNYETDRGFTNAVHRLLAIPKIYNELGWQEANYSKIESADVNHGIDYMLVGKDLNGTMEVHTVQERFRDEKYEIYNDFTLRYSRNYNSHVERRLSEYFKIESEYMTYGVINESKNHVESATDFIKYAVIDMKQFSEQVDLGNIYVDINHKKYSEITDDNKIVGGYNVNRDHSSEFVSFDIRQLAMVFGNNIILAQKGYLAQ